ncbi:hypothetical protein AYI69_g7678, partial [Smittium culicis]
MVALSESSTKIFNPFLRTLCRILDLFLNIPKISPPYLILASNTLRKKSILEAIGTDLEELLKFLDAQMPRQQLERHTLKYQKDISLSFSHFSTTSRFSLRPTYESASNTKSSANRRPGILTLFPGNIAIFSLTLSKISLMKILNSMGDIGHPCLTPLSTLNKGDIRVPILTPASGDL